MSLFYATEGEREIHHLKQKRLKGVLLYNLQEIERKRQQKDEQKNRFESSYQSLTHQAQQSLAQESRKRALRRQIERNMLKECYDRQIREKQERSRYDKVRDQQFYEKQREYLRYEEERRMIDLQKMFNRVTYEAVPLNNRYRSKTEPSPQEQFSNNPEHNTVHLPNLGQNPNRHDSRPLTFSGQRDDSKVSLPPVGERPYMDNVKVELLQKPRRSSPRYLN